jgi:hypothetical protein
MWILSGFSFLFMVGKIFNGIKGFFNRKLNQETKKVEEHDEYNLICYKIKLEDNSELIKYDLTKDELEQIEDEDNKISYITIEYTFNGETMKYITRNKDITFPIYQFKVEPPKFLYYPETIIFNDYDVTEYVSPFLGPLCNFYRDRDEPIKLKDTLIEHPEYDKMNFEEGKLIMISNITPLNGKKVKILNLPCELVWKRHAAVDPRDDDKLFEIN